MSNSTGPRRLARRGASVAGWIAAIALALPLESRAQEPVNLANDVWPPFVIAGEEQGTAEELVCTALRRAGWTCTVRTDSWAAVLGEAESGTVDGIAAIWKDADRESYLAFSRPYLTNRIVPVVHVDSDLTIRTVEDLSELKVALVADYAYGDEIRSTTGSFVTISSADPLAAMQAVRAGEAEVALVDELVARNLLDAGDVDDVLALNATLATRDLHFAVSRASPRAARLLDDFHRAYYAMLQDGTINEILDIDWVASDFGPMGRTDLVLRSGMTLDQVRHPGNEGAVYRLGSARYEPGEEAGTEDNRINYQIDGESHSTLQQAINNVFGREIGCEHKEFSSEFDCTNLLKK